MADNPLQRQGREASMLQLALVVVVLGLIAGFALDRIALLQVSANDAAMQTRAAQQRSLNAVQQARATANCSETAASASLSVSCP